MQKRQSAWEVFTWLDGCLLLPAVATGVYQAISSSVSLTGQPAAPKIGQTVLLSLTLINAVSLGGMYAGPLVLGCHFIFRKRRQCLLPGEWLWLSPLIMAGRVRLFTGRSWRSPQAPCAVLYVLHVYWCQGSTLPHCSLHIVCDRPSHHQTENDVSLDRVSWMFHLYSERCFRRVLSVCVSI